MQQQVRGELVSILRLVAPCACASALTHSRGALGQSVSHALQGMDG
jgi:hypothetical protein